MSKTKLISSAAAALTALVLMLPMTASAIPIATESTPEVVEPEDPDTQTDEPTVTDEPEDPDTQTDTKTETKATQRTQITQKTQNTKRTQTHTKATTEEPDDTESSTKKSTKATTKKTTTKTTTKRTTTSKKETTTKEEESIYSASIDVTHSGFEGTELTVKLKMDSDGIVGKAKIYLDFDEAVLEYKKSKINADDIGGTVSDSCEDGRYRLEYTNTDGIDYDGTYTTVTFTLKDKYTADQTSVVAVVNTLIDGQDRKMTNYSISNAIITLPEKTDDSSKESMPDGSDHTYVPLNLSISENGDGIKLESLGIKDYKSVEIEDDKVAYFSDGKINLLAAGESKMTVTYNDGSKGYYDLKVSDPAGASSLDEASSDESGKAVLSEDDGSSKRNTLKITAVIVIVCVALVLLIVEYFVLVGRRRKKASQSSRSGHRHRSGDDDDDYDPSEYHTHTMAAPVENVRRLEPGRSSDEDSYRHPVRKLEPEPEPVNDYADFLSGDDGEDIKFNSVGMSINTPIKQDIEDFTLSSGGVNKS